MVFMPVFVLASCCFYDYASIMNLKIRNGSPSTIIFAQACFCHVGAFMNFRNLISISVKNVTGILIDIVWKLYVVSGRMIIFI